MHENKLLDLSFEFSVEVVKLIDGVSVPKSAYMTNQHSTGREHLSEQTENPCGNDSFL